MLIWAGFSGYAEIATLLLGFSGVDVNLQGNVRYHTLVEQELKNLTSHTLFSLVGWKNGTYFSIAERPRRHSALVTSLSKYQH